MTELDQALEILQQDRRDPQNQSQYYDLVLNSNFFIPTFEDTESEGAPAAAEENQVMPLILESDGDDYMMLFDTEERLQAWAGGEVSFVEVPGHVIAEMSAPPLHWALNVGTEYSKQFLPEEIAWLRESVEKCRAEAEGEGK
ncbi:hypothetical protein DESUT3_04000 [Desulfuromonas versatilis]|uniref:SseB protein N-terminal domain-containing protein n=1 Tax=Desulfuromonas versatilis TaxID=2802975 RepID=A0ABM9SDN6_9BACT|nr:SseB family protein [Desulfuromonas versatilis]BCR03331.1 hypothetical protein DESUT3_04000 [Desulfuromonas versatilis]